MSGRRTATTGPGPGRWCWRCSGGPPTGGTRTASGDVLKDLFDTVCEEELPLQFVEGGSAVGSRRGRDLPEGAVRALFEELWRLYRRAGEPSVRQLAHSLGTGTISHTTVHAVLTGPRVPRWSSV